MGHRIAISRKISAIVAGESGDYLSTFKTQLQALHYATDARCEIRLNLAKHFFFDNFLIGEIVLRNGYLILKKRIVNDVAPPA